MRCGLLLGLSVLLTGYASAARAEVDSNNVSWPGWKVYSSEHWNLESDLVPSFPLKYPMANLFDDNPATAWVHHDVRSKHDKSKRPLYNKDSPRWISLTSEKPRWMSGVALMNGYNRRPDLFKRNDRIVEIVIEAAGEVIKRVPLSDKMGRHRVNFGRRKVESLQISFTGIRKGTAADNDVCISELALFDGTRKIEMNMPPAVLYSLSYCCGSDGYVITRNGNLLATGYNGEGYELVRSPSGRLLAGIGKNLWIVDMQRARVVLQRTLPETWQTLRWRSEKVLEYGEFDEVKQRMKTSKTIKLS